MLQQLEFLMDKNTPCPLTETMHSTLLQLDKLSTYMCQNAKVPRIKSL